MKTRLIITESQMNRLKLNLNENTLHSQMVKKMKEDLDMNYEPINKFVREGGEYSETPMFRVKADDECISPKDLYEYMKHKYETGSGFREQVIRDWVDGKITDDYRLSKNVSLK